MFTDIILRFSGEIGVKGDPVRKIWEQKVIGHISNRLNAKVEWEIGRGFVHIDSHSIQKMLDTLTRCFGLSSVSPAVSTSHTIKSMKTNATQLVEYYTTKQDVRTFGISIDTNLSDIDRMRIKNKVGAHIEQAFNLDVDLDNPDLPVRFDLRRNKGFIYSKRYAGAGGLPARVQGKAVTLLSGGPDSTLAMFLAAKRGCEVIPVFFDFGKKELREQVRTQVKQVTKTMFTKWLPYQGNLYIIPFTDIVNRIIERGRLKFAHLHLRRYMFKTAEIIAEQEGAKAIVNGEVIGEKSSQTLHNLSVTSRAIHEYPLLRPLAGKDKNEIFHELAKYDETLRELTHSSIEPCNLLTCTPPSTKADINEVRESEEFIDIKQHDLRKSVEESTILHY